MYAKGSLWDQWVFKQEELRRLTAQAFSTVVENVAITTSASAGINSVLSALEFPKNRNLILTTDLEFPTMGQILHAQERRGAKVLHLPSTTAETFDLENFESTLTPETALVAVTHICYRNGNMTDIKSVTEIAHRHGIPVLVDAYQSVGLVPIDFDEIGADFIVGGYLKYLLGIPGVGFLLAKGDSPYIPVNTGWFASRETFAMRIDRYDPATDARRFTTGTPPVPSIYGAIAGLNLLLQVGAENVWNHTIQLHAQLREEISRLGGTMITVGNRELHGGMLAIKTRNEEELVRVLDHQGIVVSSRDKNLRISPHFYNTVEDIEKVVDSIRANLHLLA
jgi:selenocysteine lyase/cysteine desulfurase